MDRRTFLKVTGFVAVAPLAEPFGRLVPAEISELASLRIQQQGMYRLSGVVRLEAPVVEISGISNRQRITWSDHDSSTPRTASFVSYERYDEPGMLPDVRIRGGRLEALSLALVE
jgi:hypothetical protein